jgi:hypothetical protein
MTTLEKRQQRRHLYELMAAMHTGPLGFSLAPKVKALATEVLELTTFPELLPEPPAALHVWNYGYCAGCPALNCGPNSPAQCLPGKFLKLAESASKGAEQRRQTEAAFIENDLVPCLVANVQQMQLEGYRSLASLSKAIVEADVPDDLVNELTALCLEETGDVSQEPKYKEKYLELLVTQEPVKQIWQGPVYWCPQTVTSSVQAVAITEANKHLLEGGLESWLPDVPHRQPFFAAVQHGKAVSVCSSVRITDNAHEAGVETLLEYRQQGHAVHVVASWTNALLGKKVIPLYSTSWENTASQNVARKAGFEFFGSDFHVT